MLRNHFVVNIMIALLFSYPTVAAQTSGNGEQYINAEEALTNNELPKAKQYIDTLLKAQPENPDYLFLAGRIAGTQAQQANIFRKLGYARKAKQYFDKALSIDPKHTDSIIGLIRFHQQAPVMAGGEKESIPGLIEQLKLADKRSAFNFEAIKLLDKEQLQELEERYLAALKDDTNAYSEEENERFKFDYAMRLSSYAHYSEALDVMLTVNISNNLSEMDFADMRLYQLAKLAAESRRELTLGIASIEQYSQLPERQRMISDDWIKFRLTQLQYLNANSNVSISDLREIQSQTDDDNLKARIKSFIAKSKT